MCCLASFQKDSAFVDSSPRKVPRQISCSAGGDSMLTGPKKGATMYFGVTRERRSQAGCHIYSFEICVKRVVVLFESSSDRFSSTIALSGGYRTFTSANATATQCAACKGGITHLSHVHRRTHVTCLAQLYSLFPLLHHFSRSPLHTCLIAYLAQAQKTYPLDCVSSQ